MTLDAKIEAALFWRAEPASVARLAKILGASEQEVWSALTSLEEKLKGRGVALVRKDDEITLRSAPEASTLIEGLAKEELSRDLGKAGLETLSIILYQGPIARRDIDYIRGVNSSFILRNLLVRGLVEKVENTENRRSFVYRPSFELLSYLGLSRVEDLPEYGSVREEIKVFESAEGAESKETEKDRYHE